MSDWGRPDQGQRHHWDGCRWSSTWAGSKWRWRGRRCGCTCRCQMRSFQKACSSSWLRSRDLQVLVEAGAARALALVGELLETLEVVEPPCHIAWGDPSGFQEVVLVHTSFQMPGTGLWLSPDPCSACSSHSPWSERSEMMKFSWIRYEWKM